MDNIKTEIIEYIVERLQYLHDANENIKILPSKKNTNLPYLNIRIYDSDISGGCYTMIVLPKDNNIILEVVNATIPKDPGVSIPLEDPNAFAKIVDNIVGRIGILFRDKLRLQKRRAKKLNQETMKNRRFLKILEAQ